jgi:hypothetical protein
MILTVRKGSLVKARFELLDVEIDELDGLCFRCFDPVSGREVHVHPPRIKIDGPKGTSYLIPYREER